MTTIAILAGSIGWLNATGSPLFGLRFLKCSTISFGRGGTRQALASSGSNGSAACRISSPAWRVATPAASPATPINEVETKERRLMNFIIGFLFSWTMVFGTWFTGFLFRQNQTVAVIYREPPAYPT